MPSAAAKTEYGLAPLGLNVTKNFCAFLATFRFDDLLEAAVHQARRGVRHWIGCALADSQHNEIQTLLSVLQSAGGSNQAHVLGHPCRLAG